MDPAVRRERQVGRRGSPPPDLCCHDSWASNRYNLAAAVASIRSSATSRRTMSGSRCSGGPYPPDPAVITSMISPARRPPDP